MAYRRSIPVAALSIALSVAAGCSGLTTVDVTAKGKATVPKGTVVDQLLGDVSFPGFQGFDIEQTQTFRNQGYTKSEINSVHIKSFSLTISKPPGETFDFLNKIYFYAQAKNQPKVEIAHEDPVAKRKGRLDLDVDSSVDLTPYVVAPSMDIVTDANGVRPQQDTTIDAVVVLSVDVNITGT